MLKILDRYLAFAVIGGTVLTLAVLLPLLGVFILADELDSIGKAQYGVVDAFRYMLLNMPRYAYELLPIATLIGALVGLGQLAAHSELVAMRAAGCSVARILRAALLGGVVLALAGFVLGEVVAPWGAQKAVELRNMALSGDVAQRTRYGFWAVDEGAYVNIREIRSGTELRDIDIYHVDADQGELIATHAAAATYRDGRWILQEIASSHASAAGVRVERVADAAWNSMLNPGLLKVVVAEPRSLPVWGLYRYIRFMQINHQDAAAYAVVFWGKVVHPLLTLTMVAVAIPLLLGSTRSGGRGLRVFLGILLGVFYYLLSRTFASLALYLGMDPLLAAFAPLTVFCAGAALLLRRQRV